MLRVSVRFREMFLGDKLVKFMGCYREELVFRKKYPSYLLIAEWILKLAQGCNLKGKEKNNLSSLLEKKIE